MPISGYARRRSIPLIVDDAHPGVKQAFEQASGVGRDRPIHHRIPLEWAHRTPALDINGPSNLVMVHKEVHTGINAAWTRFRTVSASKVTGQHVKQESNS